MVNGYSILFDLALPVRQFSEHLEICFWGPTLTHQKTALYACSYTYLLSYRHIIFSRNFIWDLALTKLYANCLLSSLNARAGIKESTSHQSGQCHQISVTSGTSRLAVCVFGRDILLVGITDEVFIRILTWMMLSHMWVFSFFCRLDQFQFCDRFMSRPPYSRWILEEMIGRLNGRLVLIMMTWNLV